MKTDFIKLTCPFSEKEIIVRKNQVACFCRVTDQERTQIFLSNSAGYRFLVKESFETVENLLTK